MKTVFEGCARHGRLLKIRRYRIYYCVRFIEVHRKSAVDAAEKA